MGCDIHSYAEVKNKDGAWESVGAIFANPYYDAERPESEWNMPRTVHPYQHRNYDLFALLADVRNQFGIIPIAGARGLPDDVSPEVTKESKEYDCDGHSHTWLLLSELQQVDYANIPVTTSGVMKAATYKSWDKRSILDEYSQGVWGPSVVIVPAEAYDKLNALGALAPHVYWYVSASWTLPLGICIGNDWIECLDELAKLGEPDNVRFVCWFDN